MLSLLDVLAKMSQQLAKYIIYSLVICMDMANPNGESKKMKKKKKKKNRSDN
jgi:hypothetical protein